MKIRPLLLVLSVLVLAATPARAQFFVGPNLEWSHWSYPAPNRDFSGDVVSIGGESLNPSLRLGFLIPGGALMPFADVGIQSEQLGLLKYTNLIAEVTLAHVFLRERAASPYVGISSGYHYLNGFERRTRTVIGGAIGVRHRVAAGHGSIRAEFRFDHFVKKETGSLILPENTIGLRVGCDLFLSP